MKDLYSHINTLNLTSSTFIAQESARRACLDIVSIIHNKKFSGLTFILYGGNSINTLVSGIEKDLGDEFNIVKVNGLEIKTIEDIDIIIKRSIKVKIEEIKDCLEGEVTKINFIEKNKTIEKIEIGIKTTKGIKVSKLSGDFYREIKAQRIEEGDIIYIEASAGLIKRLGRSETFVKAYDLERDKYIPLPTNDVRIKKKITKELNLYNFNPTKEIEELITKYEEEGHAQTIAGVIYIEDVENLSIKCAEYLSKIIEDDKSPTILLSTKKIENINNKILERALIIKTDVLKAEDIIKILKIKSMDSIKEDIIVFIANLNIKLKHKVEILEMLKNKENKEISDVEEIMNIFNFQ